MVYNHMLSKTDWFILLHSKNIISKFAKEPTIDRKMNEKKTPEIDEMKQRTPYRQQGERAKLLQIQNVAVLQQETSI